MGRYGPRFSKKLLTSEIKQFNLVTKVGYMKNRKKLILDLLIIIISLIGIFFVDFAEAKEQKRKTITVDFSKPVVQTITYEPLVIIGVRK